MTGDPIRDELIREIGRFVLQTEDDDNQHEATHVINVLQRSEIAAIVDALGLVTDRKLRILVQEGYVFNTDGGWTLEQLSKAWREREP